MSEGARAWLKASSVLLIFPSRVAIWIGVWAIVAGTPEFKLYGLGLLAVGIGGYALLVWAIDSLSPLHPKRGQNTAINWRGMPTAFERSWLGVYGRASVARPKPH